MLECPPPSSSPIYPSNVGPLLLNSFFEYLLNVHSVRHYAKCQATTEKKTDRLSVAMLFIVL